MIAWMFPKRDHLSIGLGIAGQRFGTELRAELDAFLPTVASAALSRRRATRFAKRAICSTAVRRGRTIATAT